MTNKKRVSAIIPNYNGLHLLKSNLPSVLKCLHDKDELVIVDDKSTDGGVVWLVNKFSARNQKIRTPKGIQKVKIGRYTQVDKEIRVVIAVNGKNLRFAKTANRGVNLAKHELIFLINNDVSPHKDCLKYLTEHFSNNKVFGVGCREIERNLDDIDGGKNVLRFKRGMFIHQRASEFTFGSTAWASGGSAMFDKQKWAELEGFDDLFYPAYWEDIDLSFRARKKGWQILFDPRAVVDHNHESTNQLVFGQNNINLMSWNNAKKFVIKNGNLLQKVLYKLWRPYWWWKVERNFKE